MKILFVCENYYPHYGGAEVLFKNLAEGYVRQGHDVSLITQRLKDTTTGESINGVSITRVFSFFSRYLFSFLAIPQTILATRKHDLVQTTTFNGALPAWIAAKVWRKPVVITIHEVWAGRWQEITGFPKWKSAIHELLETALYVLPFDKYICVSEATRNDLLKIGFPPEKVEQIYNGFNYQDWNTQKFSPEKVQQIRDRLGDNKFIYFSWGRPGVSKGFEYFIQAAPAVIEQKENALFILMLGSADKYKKKHEELQQLIKRLQLQEKVRIINSAPYSELGHYILASDCIIVPSIAEGFGYTTLEANTLGKPVLISNAGSLPEVVSGKYNLFRSKDIHDLAEKAICCAQGQYTETALKKFPWEKTIQEYLKIYQEQLSGSDV